MPQHHSLYPVNTRTGNFWTRATDLVVAGTAAAPAIPFGRTYASQSINETIGALGYGWQHRLRHAGDHAGCARRRGSTDHRSVAGEQPAAL